MEITPLKSILIVDDEDSVLNVLRNSLKKFSDAYDVSVASSGNQALEMVKQRPFDLVVTDYRMPDLTGLELMESIHVMRPGTRVILMTAFGSPSLEKHAERLSVYRYLPKPLDINIFREIVQEAMSQPEVAAAMRGQKRGLLVLSDESYKQMHGMLKQLQADIGARCIFLADGNGQFIAQTGDVGAIAIDQIASLVGGAVVSLFEVGRLLDGSEDTINLCYREGKRENLYVVNVGLQLLLVIVVECGQYSSKLGSVWYFAQQSALKLRDLLGAMDYAQQSDDLLGQNVDGNLDDEFDQLFGD